MLLERYKVYNRDFKENSSLVSFKPWDGYFNT